MIHYRNIHKAFDGTPVLSGVEMQVEQGEMFALFGPSGTGKSVLLKTTIALLTPDRGDVELGGISVHFGDNGALQEVRRKVGYVFQHAALFDSFNVFENVAMGLPDDTQADMTRHEIAARVWQALDLVNLEPAEVMSKIPAELSGGMKKRVGIARAIVGRPEVLLWDEPTTGLDPINTAAIERLIVRLSEELEVTSLLVTHDVEGGLMICDRVAMLDGGVLRFCGTPDEFRNCADPIVKAFVDRESAVAALDMEIR